MDDNQKLLVKELRKLGFSVAVTSSLGGGFPDIVVGKRHRNWLFEIKDGSKPPSARKLTSDEEDFYREWLGQIDVIENLDDAIDILHRDEGHAN